MPRTQKELVINQIEHRETDPVPYTIDFEGDVPEELDMYFGSGEWRSMLEQAIVRLPLPGQGF